MRVLVTGANGFIGSQIVSALVQAGHDVVRAVRNPAGKRSDEIACDFSRDTRTSAWLPRLNGIDAVVNCAGILRERGANRFEVVHTTAPRALFDACAQAGVHKLIQISALGTADDGEFIRSKHRADEHLRTLQLAWVVLRPSVVYSTSGSYGGTSLLRALAALPFFLCVPGDGQQQLQPIHGEDLGRAVARLVASDDGDHKVLEAVGPAPVSFADYLRALRRWLGFGEPRLLHVPMWLAGVGAWMGERLGRGPLGLTMLRMLRHGNTAPPGAAETFATAIGFRPRSVQEAFEGVPSFVQDRWHARLYLLAPVLRVALGALWVGSGVTGFALAPEQAGELVARAGFTVNPALLVYPASTLDLVLGAAMLLRWQIRIVGTLMVLSLLAYTLLLGAAMPALWLEPFGSLLKNLPLVPAVLIMMVLEDRR
jgi:uncharacterized protein YbjT (DUF2867 family)